MVGAGALGSWASDFLGKRLKALTMPLPMRIIDFDEVDNRNYANQFFTLAHQDKPKAEIVAKRLEGYDILATPVVEKIDENNIEELIKPDSTRFMLSLVDNVEARTLLWMMSVRHDIPCLHAGVSKSGHGTVYWTAQGFDHYFNMGIKGRLQGNSTQGAEKAVDEKLPPCEMLEFGMLCLQTAMAIAKASTLHLGKDPEEVFGGEEPPEGTMVSFKSLPDFHQVDSAKQVRVHGQDEDKESEAADAEDEGSEGEGEKDGVEKVAVEKP